MMKRYLTEFELDLMLTVAWSAPLTTAQVNHIVDPRRNQRATLAVLRRLDTLGLMNKFLYQKAEERGRPPVRVGFVWSVTQAGFALLPEDRRPAEPAGMRRTLLDHDLVIGTFLTAVIDRARPVLSGVTVDHEIRLNPPEKRPKCDAIVVLRHHPNQTVETVPWLTSFVAPGEQVRGWALEVDRGTEGIAVIRDKATAYRKVWNDPAFYARYGKMPIPLWICKDTARADAIMKAWAQVWPEGRWYMTTEAHVPRLLCVEWSAGQQRRLGVLDGWAC